MQSLATVARLIVYHSNHSYINTQRLHFAPKVNKLKVKVKINYKSLKFSVNSYVCLLSVISKDELLPAAMPRWTK